MSFQNTTRDIYNPGSDITARATDAVAGKRFAAVSAGITDNVVSVEPCSSGDRPFGVAKYDADSGELVGIARGSGRVLVVEAGGSLSAGDEVAVGSGSRAVSAGEDDVVVAVALASASSGDDVAVSLV